MGLNIAEGCQFRMFMIPTKITEFLVRMFMTEIECVMVEAWSEQGYLLT